MLVSTLIAIPFTYFQKDRIVETKLMSLQKNKFVPSTIFLSPDFEHISYQTPDHKVVIDGKTFGPFLLASNVVYSGDSKDYAFVSVAKQGDLPILFWNGIEKVTDFPVNNVFRAGDTGPVCWTEKDKETGKFRLVTPDETTDWFGKIDRVVFNDDGSNFYIRTVEKIPRDPSAPPDASIPDSKDYVVYKGGKKVARDLVLQIFIAPKQGGFAAVRSATSSVGQVIPGYEIVTKAGVYPYRGELFGNPVYSSDGKQFAFRSRFTVPGVVSNQDHIQYVINGKHITDLELQSGLTFSDDGQKWFMCGLNDKKPFLLTSWNGLTSYGQVTGLGGAPPEPYKFAKFVNDKMVFLFQSRRSKPLLFVEDHGLVELGSYITLPDTTSISPDGKFLAVAGTDGSVNHAYVVDLEHPVAGIETLRGAYELQVTGASTFAWKGDHTLRFAATRKSDLFREAIEL